MLRPFIVKVSVLCYFTLVVYTYIGCPYSDMGTEPTDNPIIYEIKRLYKI